MLIDHILFPFLICTTRPKLEPKVSTVCALSTVQMGLVIDNYKPTDGNNLRAISQRRILPRSFK